MTQRELLFATDMDEGFTSRIVSRLEEKEVIKILNEDFTSNDSVGAVRVARFITGGRDEAIQAEVAGFVRNLLDLCKLDKI